MSAATKSLLLSSLTNYFQRNQRHRKELWGIITGTSPISLRVIDWFVTHYSKTNSVIYWIDDTGPTTRLVEESPPGAPYRKFHLSAEYRAQLKSYTKAFFDPFRRHERITFVLEPDNTPYSKEIVSVETTVGQLNFFRWALQNHVIEYIRNHLPEIEAHISRYHQRKREPGGGAVQEAPLVAAANVPNPAPATITRANTHLRFD